MGTLIFTVTLILVVLGFSNHVLWLAAIGLLFLYIRYGTGRGNTSAASGTPASSGAAGGGAGRMDSSYRAYRDRRDRQAKWERRYRRERPWEARRQERQKNS
ncbi:hypothetical protein ACFV6E_25470 [Streptomyces sp. NPDC059785]|uniref:hypothetical protein n=1 Tax=unclassified Streptomyces TaxID=2593676 RepID=UPI00365758EE